MSLLLTCILIFQAWAYEYFPSIAPALVDPTEFHFPVCWRWFLDRIHDRSFEIVDRYGAEDLLRYCSYY